MINEYASFMEKYRLLKTENKEFKRENNMLQDCLDGCQNQIDCLYDQIVELGGDD